MEEFVCRICGGKEYSITFSRIDKDSKEIEQVYTCMNCSTVFLFPEQFTLPKVKYIVCSEKAKEPIRATEGAVGFDLYSTKKIECWPGKPELVPTDLSVELPMNTEMQIRGRSGLSKKGLMIANGVGTIDPDYRGPLMVLIINQRPGVFIIGEGERIAQALITTKLPYKFEQVVKLSDTERGKGGFGSTGAK